MVAYHLEKREEETILDDAIGYEISADGKKTLAAQRRSFYIVDIRAKQKLTKSLRTNELENMVDPQLERAIEEVLHLLQTNPPKEPTRLAYQDRTGKAEK